MHQESTQIDTGILVFGLWFGSSGMTTKMLLLDLNEQKEAISILSFSLRHLEQFVNSTSLDLIIYEPLLSVL